MTVPLPRCMCVLDPLVQEKLNGWMTLMESVTGLLYPATMLDQ